MSTTRRASTAIYNPHLLRRDDLIATFVARRPLLEELLDDLRRGGGQHHLLIGARGSGKTSLLLRLAYAIEDDKKLSRTCVPLRFPEEQYNVSRPSDFWMNCIDALTDTLEQRGDKEGVKKLDAAVADLENLKEDERAERALSFLTSWTKRTKKMVVLLVDNLDLVLARLSDAHWGLREALSADNRLVLIGASSTFIQDAFVYDSPFYDFFNVHELGPLPEDEARDLVIELGRLTGKPEVEKIIKGDPGRFKALYVLTGGMPRVLALLHGILADGNNARVEEDLEGLLDQLTPYYKARFDDLPAQSQIIMDAVALHWHPITASACADATRLSVNVVSAQLDRLCRQGLIGKVALPGAAKLGFQLSERFFNIWYLMRASRRLRRRLGWLVEFLRVFYGEEEIQKRAEEMLASPAGRKAEAGGAARLLAYATAVTDPRIRRRLELRAAEVSVREYSRSEELNELLDLDGEDAHLAPVLSRAKTMRSLKNRIEKAETAWPPGVTAAKFADALVCDPSLSIQVKIALTEELEAASLSAVLIGKITRRKHESLGARLCEAIGSGEMPALSEVSRPEEVDDIAGIADDPDSALFRMVFLCETPSRPQTPDAVINRALHLGKAAADAVFITITAKIMNNEWPLVRRRILQVFEHWASTATVPETRILRIVCQVGVQHGLASDIADLLKQAAMSERLLPFHEALRAAAGQPPPANLAHLAPEVRAPAEELLKFFLEPVAKLVPVANKRAPRPRR